MQHYILCAFRKVLTCAPVVLKVFREEGIWELIFSEKFFYFRPSSEELLLDIGIQSEGFLQTRDLSSGSESPKEDVKPIGVDVLQVEAISFLEFAATLDGNTNNLVKSSSPISCSTRVIILDSH